MSQHLKIIILDPTNHFRPKGATDDALMESMGFIPSFIDTSDGTKLKVQIETNYPYFNEWDNKFNLTEEGVYQYPEDPDLYPIGIIQSTNPAHEGQWIIIYQFGMVVTVNVADKEMLSTRMD